MSPRALGLVRHSRRGGTLSPRAGAQRPLGAAASHSRTSGTENPGQGPCVRGQPVPEGVVIPAGVPGIPGPPRGPRHPPAKREASESPERPPEPGPPSAGGTSARARQGGAAARRCDARFTWRGVGLQGVASGGTPRARELRRDRQGRSGFDLRGGCMPTALPPGARPQPRRPPPATRDLPAAVGQDLDYLLNGCCAISWLNCSQMPVLEPRVHSPRCAHSHISQGPIPSPEIPHIGLLASLDKFPSSATVLGWPLCAGRREGYKGILISLSSWLSPENFMWL